MTNMLPRRSLKRLSPMLFQKCAEKKGCFSPNPVRSISVGEARKTISHFYALG